MGHKHKAWPMLHGLTIIFINPFYVNKSKCSSLNVVDRGLSQVIEPWLIYLGSKWWWLHAACKLHPLTSVKPSDQYFEILFLLSKIFLGKNRFETKCWIKIRNQIKVISNTFHRKKIPANQMRFLQWTNRKLLQLWPIRTLSTQFNGDPNMIY